jgi:hypothetical protein
LFPCSIGLKIKGFIFKNRFNLPDIKQTYPYKLTRIEAKVNAHIKLQKEAIGQNVGTQRDKAAFCRIIKAKKYIKTSKKVRATVR